MSFCKFRAIAAAVSLSLPLITFATDLSNSVSGTVSDGSASIPYRLFQPTGVAAGQKVPLILYLHGMGDRGTDNTAQTYWMDNLQKNTASGKNAAYVLAPQISSSMWFSSTGSAQTEAENLTMQALKQAEQNPNIDTSRIYITGVSMGSFGTWDLLQRNPNTFAAAVPMSAGGDPSTAGAIGKTPVWAFHGSADQVVPVQTSRDMVAALQAAGGNVKYTEIAGGDHFIWPEVYSDPSLYSWLFGQHTGDGALTTVSSPSDPASSDPTVDATSTVPGPVVSVVHHTNAMTRAAAQAAVAVPVPEPTTMGLIAMGGMALFVRRNRARC